MLENSQVQYTHLNSLDGFRGCLALWVFLGHLSSTVGFHIPIISSPGYAVDLFMILSGFLMMRTWGPKISNAVVASRMSMAFYISRYFRIAPLFYLLLIICYCFLGELTDMGNFNSKQIPPPWVTDLTNYAPNQSWDFLNIKWIYLHASLLFGMLPGMENSSPLPEWSLSLEMQFYLIFPLLLFFIKRSFLLPLSIISAAFCIASPMFFGLYLEPGSITHYGQPSLLLYRLNAFVAGIIAAQLLHGKSANNKLNKHFLILAAGICILPLNKLVIFGYLFFLALILYKIPIITFLLGNKPMKFLGNISYSLYLSHVLITTPVVYYLIKYENLINYAPSIRFALSMAISLPIIIICSYALYKFIELPSIAFGKLRLAKFTNAL